VSRRVQTAFAEVYGGLAEAMRRRQEPAYMHKNRDEPCVDEAARPIFESDTPYETDPAGQRSPDEWPSRECDPCRLSFELHERFLVAAPN